MSACNRIKLSPRTVCTSDLNERIKIQKRTLTSADFDDLDPTEKFVDLTKLWAGVKTNRGFKSFNDVGTNETGSVTAQTHLFYIRYLAGCDITSENWIEWKCDKYSIQSVENLDGGDEFMLLRAIKHGPKSLDANLA